MNIFGLRLLDTEKTHQIIPCLGLFEGVPPLPGDEGVPFIEVPPQYKERFQVLLSIFYKVVGERGMPNGSSTLGEGGGTP